MATPPSGKRALTLEDFREWGRQGGKSNKKKNPSFLDKDKSNKTREARKRGTWHKKRFQPNRDERIALVRTMKKARAKFGDEEEGAFWLQMVEEHGSLFSTKKRAENKLKLWYAEHQKDLEDRDKAMDHGNSWTADGTISLHQY